MPTNRVIVTRPDREAQDWAVRLRAIGVDSIVMPLIELAEAPDRCAVDDARARLHAYDALMFVSAAAATSFFSGRPWAGGDAKPRMWATGSGTADALQRMGVPASVIDRPGPDAERFDSEALWCVVHPQVVTGFKVLIVRGADLQGRPAGRAWLADRITSMGGRLDIIAAYTRRAPMLDEQARQTAAECNRDGSIWLFSSSDAVSHLVDILPAIDWTEARAVATHPRIAQALQAAGFGRVVVARAGFDGVVASIESFG